MRQDCKSARGNNARLDDCYPRKGYFELANRGSYGFTFEREVVH
jgi:hypothetical protein